MGQFTIAWTVGSRWPYHDLSHKVPRVLSLASRSRYSDHKAGALRVLTNLSDPHLFICFKFLQNLELHSEWSKSLLTDQLQHVLQLFSSGVTHWLGLHKESLDRLLLLEE